MSMQDKEMDDLFRSKLDDYEIEPSSRVWQGIAGELDGPKKKFAIVPMLRIAATVLVVFSAGFYFWPKQQTVNDGDQSKKMASVIKPAIKVEQATAPQTTESAQPVKLAKPIHQAINAIPKTVYAAAQHPKSMSQNTAINIATQVAGPVTINEAPIKQPEPVLAVVQTPANPVIIPQPAATGRTAVVPDGIDLKAAAIPATDNQQMLANQPVKKNKIRGLGGLLNAAISLVDTREDKIIEFGNKEDGATITGVNLGIVAIKKSSSK